MTGIDPPTLQRRRKTAVPTAIRSDTLASRGGPATACRAQKALWNEQAWSSPNATDEPQQQEEPEGRSQASQASKQPVDGQGHDQDAAAPPPVSQVSPHVAAHHHSFEQQREQGRYCQVFWTLLTTKTNWNNFVRVKYVTA